MQQHVFEASEKNVDLKDSCREWDKTLPADQIWVGMRKHFSLEIQRNRTDPSEMKELGKANAVLEQVK